MSNPKKKSGFRNVSSFNNLFRVYSDSVLLSIIDIGLAVVINVIIIMIANAQCYQDGGKATGRGLWAIGKGFAGEATGFRK